MDGSIVPDRIGTIAFVPEVVGATGLVMTPACPGVGDAKIKSEAETCVGSMESR